MKKILIILTIIVVLFGSFWVYLNLNSSVPILMYHSLDASRVKTYAAVAPETFSRQMEFIKNRKYRVISLEEYCRLLSEKKSFPCKAVVITFDDGYRDNLQAVKILEELDFPATIFIIADNIGKEGFLTSGDIRNFLSTSRVRIGSHTLHHTYLPDLSSAEMNREVFQSRKVLENEYKQTIETFSYPSGGFNKEALKAVKDAGYLCACATNRGFSRQLDLLALRRIKITERDSGFSLWAKLSGFYNIFKKPKNPY